MSSLSFALTYSKKMYLNNVIKRFYSTPIPLKHVSLIQQLTKCPESEVLSCLKSNKHIQRLDEEELELRINKLYEFEFEDESALDRLALVKHHPKTVRHRYVTLQEFGIQPLRISSYMLVKYLTFAKTKVSTLKKKKFMNDDTDVAARLLSYTPLPCNSLDGVFTDSNTPDQIKVFVMKKILTDHVGFIEPYSEEPNLVRRLRHKSISETLRNLEILENVVGMSKEKIRNNPFLLSAADPDNSLAIISSFPAIADVDIKTVLRSHPKILASSVDSLLKIYSYLQEAEISDKALSKCFEVFTLNSDTVHNRLNEFKKNSFFALCRHHPRILELIMYQNKAKERLDKLKQVKIDFVSLNLLASPDKFFERYFECGSERHHGMDSVYFLCEELGCGKEALKKKLQKHPYWIYISLFTINNNLRVLLDRGFSKQEIFHQVYILLYPTKVVLDELEATCSRKESDVCRDGSGALDRSYLLPLTLYYIERQSNFNGSAIWLKKSPDSSP